MFKTEPITSFGEIKLKLSGMRITEVYEIICRGGEAEISLYWISYKNREEKYNLSKRATVPADEILGVLNECKVIKWDGFYGKNPPGMLDGTMFDFNAEVNGGRKLSAHGSNNYPKRYRDFMTAIDSMLDGEK